MLLGYDDRRPHRDRSWEGRSGSMDRERGYINPHKDWDNDDYRPGGGGGGDWGRDRHWGMHEPQVMLYGLNKSITRISCLILTSLLSNYFSFR